VRDRARRLLTTFSVLGVLSTGAAGLAFVALAPACAERTCEGQGLDYGRGAGEGHLIDEDTWESTPVEGKWLHYPAQREYFIFPGRLLGPKRIAKVTVYISPMDQPNPDGQYTVASGNVAIVRQFPDLGNQALPGVSVRNDTCAEFWVRIVLEAYPLPPNQDGGTDADADATSDAAVEASTDAADAQPDAPTDGPTE
jgi:hypothetical protein